MMIQGIDHVEWYVSDLKKTAGRLCHDFGFRIAGHYDPAPAGPGSAAGGRSLLLRQGQITLLLTAAAGPDHPAAEYVRRHGDGVAVIAFGTDDVQAAFDTAIAGGAVPIAAPAFDEGRRAGTAVVSGFGDVTHKLIERDGPAPAAEQAAEPGAEQAAEPGAERGDLLEVLDHIAVCLPAGQLDATVRFYRDAFGLTQVFDERIEANGQAMLSKVVQDEARFVTFTLIEPDATLDPGQIDQFLRAHGGAGVQHLAFGTSDIAQAVGALADRGVGFLTAPPGYYRTLETRLGTLAIPASELEKLNVLADTDRWGQLFQIFTRSTHERRTFFMELIERQGALTFGSRNIRALYEALGGEQESLTATT
jgi:4-hydroxymandelate synthase